MERLNKCISSVPKSKGGTPVLCGPKSIRCLTVTSDFDEGLLHGLCSMSKTVNVVMFRTVYFSELQDSDWTSQTDWVQDIARAGSAWVLPIRDGNCWQPVHLSWPDRRILCYNPISSLVAEKRSNRILKVGRRSAFLVWVQTDNDFSRHLRSGSEP
jgi:hypothetical protein